MPPPRITVNLSDLTPTDLVNLAAALVRAGGRRDLSRRVGRALDTLAVSVAQAAQKAAEPRSDPTEGKPH